MRMSENDENIQLDEELDDETLTEGNDDDSDSGTEA